MSLTAEEASHQPIPTDADVEVRVAGLIGRATQRQFWMLFVDDEDVQLPLVMPMADYPTTPYDGRAQLLASRIAELIEMLGGARVIFVWERRLTATPTEADRAWARELGDACATVGVDVRGQLISHRDGVCWFAADDYL